MYLLLVENNYISSREIGGLLKRNNIKCDIVNCSSSESLLDIAEKLAPDIIIIDFDYYIDSSAEIVSKLRHFNTGAYILAFIDPDHYQKLVKAIELGIDDYMFKPLQREDVMLRIKMGLQRKQLLTKEAFEADPHNYESLEPEHDLPETKNFYSNLKEYFNGEIEKTSQEQNEDLPSTEDDENEKYESQDIVFSRDEEVEKLDNAYFDVEDNNLTFQSSNLGISDASSFSSQAKEDPEEKLEDLECSSEDEDVREDLKEEEPSYPEHQNDCQEEDEGEESEGEQAFQDLLFSELDQGFEEEELRFDGLAGPSEQGSALDEASNDQEAYQESYDEGFELKSDPGKKGESEPKPGKGEPVETATSTQEPGFDRSWAGQEDLNSEEDSFNNGPDTGYIAGEEDKTGDSPENLDDSELFGTKQKEKVVDTRSFEELFDSMDSRKKKKRRGTGSEFKQDKHSNVEYIFPHSKNKESQRHNRKVNSSDNIHSKDEQDRTSRKANKLIKVAGSLLYGMLFVYFIGITFFLIQNNFFAQLAVTDILVTAFPVLNSVLEFAQSLQGLLLLVFVPGAVIISMEIRRLHHYIANSKEQDQDRLAGEESMSLPHQKEQPAQNYLVGGGRPVDKS